MSAKLLLLLSNYLYLFRIKQIFWKKCQSCLQERTLLNENPFGEKPQRDESKRGSEQLRLFDFSPSAYAFASKKPGVSSFLLFRYRNGELFRGSDESFGTDGFAGESGCPDGEDGHLFANIEGAFSDACGGGRDCEFL